MTDPSAARGLAPARAVLRLAWPLALKAIMLHGILVIDAWLVAPLGEGAVAVMGLSASIAGLVLGMIFAFSTATQIRIAQAFGTGDPAFLRSVLGAGVAVNIGVALSGLVILALSAGAIIDTLAHDAVIAEQARRYLAVFAIVILAEALGQCLTSYFNGCGRTRLPLYSFLLAAPVNVIASLILIHGLLGAPAMGVTGAAAGSAIASVLRAAFLLRALAREGAGAGAGGAPGAVLWRHLVFSLPIAATFASQTVANSVCGLFYAALPVNQFAAITIILPWIQVAGAIGMAWAQATGIIVAQMLGQGRGAGQATGALDAFLSGAWRATFLVAALVSAIYAGVCLAAPWVYAELHVDTRMMLAAFLPVLVVLPFPKQSNAICGQTLRAGGDTVHVMHIFVWSQWLFRVPATAALVLLLDVSPTWIVALLLGEELVKFAPFHLRLRKGAWKRGDLRR